MNEDTLIALIIKALMEGGIIVDLTMATLVIVISLLFKEAAQNLIEGLCFYFKKAYKEGDQVYVDDRKAVVVKISITRTIFQSSDERGVIWRYVANNRMKHLKIEKVVEKKEATITTDGDRVVAKRVSVNSEQDHDIDVDVN